MAISKLHDRRTFFACLAAAAIGPIGGRIEGARRRDHEAGLRLAAIGRQNRRNFRNVGQLNSFTTPEANFLLWYSEHSGRDRAAPENTKIDLATMRSITEQHPNLIYVPEMILNMEESALEQMIRGENGYLGMVEISSRNFLTREAARHLIENDTPLLLVDYLFSRGMRYSLFALILQQIVFYGIPLQLGLSSALYLDSAVQQTSRRKFTKDLLIAAGFQATAILEGLYNSYAYYPSTREILVRDFTFSLRFRNALVAYKLLKWTKAFQLRTGNKPTFLLTLGCLHQDITQNFHRGNDYNRQELREAREVMGFMRHHYGDMFYKAFFFDPQQGPLAQEIEFPGIREF